jgi:hypothetical protein
MVTFDKYLKEQLKGTSKYSFSDASGWEFYCAALRSFTESQRIRLNRAPGAVNFLSASRRN